MRLLWSRPLRQAPGVVRCRSKGGAVARRIYQRWRYQRWLLKKRPRTSAKLTLFRAAEHQALMGCTFVSIYFPTVYMNALSKRRFRFFSFCLW